MHKLFLFSLLGLLGPLAAAGEEPAAPPPAPVAAAATTAPKWYEAVEVHGYVDGYYGLRFGAPQNALNELRAFDQPNGFVLNLAKATVLMNPTATVPVGFRIDLGFGNTMNAIAAASPYLGPSYGANGNAEEAFKFVEQAFGTLKLGDVTVDLGRFVTSAGAEVIEAKDNWNYSRSLLFTWAIPFTHTGLRVGYAVPGIEGLTLQAGLVNGWDVTVTNSPFKTLNLAAIWNGPDSTILSLVYYGGPNPSLVTGAVAPYPSPTYGPSGNAYGGWQNLLDLVVQRAFGDLTVNVNGDLGILAGVGRWEGFSLMARYSALGDKLRIAARYEYFWDLQGVRLGVNGGQYTEGTVTLGVPVSSNAEVRLEYRIDHANKPIFYAGGNNDNTLEAALMAWF
ncbi:MAG TPA: outer membrane beta-barrel protein [Anaeromyxobacteraceae bacterium]|nr:outer membrane beta-barrel protein [Anaeromyxobacteraceae bacterium]